MLNPESDDFVVSEECGAIASFHGTTRNSSKDGKECIRLDYASYPEMALKQLENIIKNVISKYNLHKVAVEHHIGSVLPLESGVIGKNVNSPNNNYSLFDFYIIYIPNIS